MEEKDEGFTLIELLVVIIIIGILAAIAVPVFLNQRKKGWDSQAKADLKNMATAEETWLTDKGVYSSDVTELESVGFKKSADNVNHKAVGTSATSYCLSVDSKSGTTWKYESATGTPVAGAAC
jgi:type IV pilus assembly protein PilA